MFDEKMAWDYNMPTWDLYNKIKFPIRKFYLFNKLL